MKVTKLALIGVLLVPAVGIYTHPAQAQNAVLKRGQLPDASKVIASPFKVQLVDDGPIVSDHRKRDSSTTYVINVPPLPPAQHNVVQIGDPSAPGTIGGGGAQIPIQSNNLPDASGFQSNIPAKGVGPDRSLPNGTTTNGLKKVMAQKLPGGSNAPVGATAHPSSHNQTPPAPQSTLTYAQSPTSVSTSHETRIRVSGQKIPRGSLLDGK